MVSARGDSERHLDASAHETLMLVTAETTDDLDISTIRSGTHEAPVTLIDSESWINEPMLSPDGVWMVPATGFAVSGVVKCMFRSPYWYGSAGITGHGGRAWDIDLNNGRFLMITLPGVSEGDSAPDGLRIGVVLD